MALGSAGTLKGKAKPLIRKHGFSFPFNPILFRHRQRALPFGNPFGQTLLTELHFGRLIRSLGAKEWSKFNVEKPLSMTESAHSVMETLHS